MLPKASESSIDWKGFAEGVAQIAGVDTDVYLMLGMEHMVEKEVIERTLKESGVTKVNIGDID